MQLVFIAAEGDGVLEVHLLARLRQLIRIELVEIPTNDETNDNIVTYWTPDQLPEPGKEMNFSLCPTPLSG
jgi:hypothetical protein